MTHVHLIIPGKPIPKKRPRVVRGRAFTPRESVEYESRVAYEAEQCKVTFLPKTKLCVSLAFYLHNRSYQLTDIDNLIKSALDGLQKGGMFDDRDVDYVIGRKHVCEGDQERTVVRVTTIRSSSKLHQ